MLLLLSFWTRCEIALFSLRLRLHHTHTHTHSSLLAAYVERSLSVIQHLRRRPLTLFSQRWSLRGRLSDEHTVTWSCVFSRCIANVHSMQRLLMSASPTHTVYTASDIRSDATSTGARSLSMLSRATVKLNNVTCTRTQLSCYGITVLIDPAFCII